MKHVGDIEEMVRNAVPETPTLTTRKDRLMYWAALIRQAPADLYLYHDLERHSKSQLDKAEVPAYDNGGCSAFGLVVGDKHLQEAGAGVTIGKQMDYFQLSQAEMHEFSCDCGGHISKDEMANRIEKLANNEGTNQNPGFISRVASALGM